MSSPTCAQVIEPLRVGAWDAVGVSEGNDVGAADGVEEVAAGEAVVEGDVDGGDVDPFAVDEQRRRVARRRLAEVGDERAARRVAREPRRRRRDRAQVLEHVDGVLGIEDVARDEAERLRAARAADLRDALADGALGAEVDDDVARVDVAQQAVRRRGRRERRRRARDRRRRRQLDDARRVGLEQHDVLDLAQVERVEHLRLHLAARRRVVRAQHVTVRLQPPPHPLVVALHLAQHVPADRDRISVHRRHRHKRGISRPSLRIQARNEHWQGYPQVIQWWNWLSS